MIGKRVVFHSLTGRPDLNGKSGVVTTFDASTGRAAVQVGAADLLAMKPANLSVVYGSGTEMEHLVTAIAKLCSSTGSGWHSADAVHARLREDEQWAGLSYGKVQAACAILVRAQSTPAKPAVTPFSSAASTFAAPDDASVAPTSTSRRVGEILQILREAKPGTERRRAHVEELLSLLKEHGSKRSVVNALTDGEGPQILYAIENSMQGDWKTDARNGTLKNIGELMRLPGPAGLAIAQYCLMMSAKVEAAAKNKHQECEH